MQCGYDLTDDNRNRYVYVPGVRANCVVLEHIQWQMKWKWNDGVLIRPLLCTLFRLSWDAGDNEAKLMTKLAPEWVRTSDPVIRSPARYRWTTAPATHPVTREAVDTYWKKNQNSSNLGHTSCRSAHKNKLSNFRHPSPSQAPKRPSIIYWIGLGNKHAIFMTKCQRGHYMSRSSQRKRNNFPVEWRDILCIRSHIIIDQGRKRNTSAWLVYYTLKLNTVWQWSSGRIDYR